MVPSVMDSPICGITISVGMKVSSPSSAGMGLKNQPVIVRCAVEHTRMGLYGGEAFTGR
jgi:hypothetical protein